MLLSMLTLTMFVGYQEVHPAVKNTAQLLSDYYYYYYYYINRTQGTVVNTRKNTII